MLANANVTDSYIGFQDSNVKSICINNFSTDKVGLTYTDAANVTSIGTLFQKNTTITKFNELVYFTSIATFKTSYTGVFENDTNLTEVSLPVCVDKTIGTRMFALSGLSGTFTIPEGYTLIGDTAFGGCNISTLVIPSTVTTINNTILHSNKVKVMIICKATTPPTISTASGSAPFGYLSQGVSSIKVPSASVSAYKADSKWGYYSNYIVAI